MIAKKRKLLLATMLVILFMGACLYDYYVSTEHVVPSIIRQYPEYFLQNYEYDQIISVRANGLTDNGSWSYRDLVVTHKYYQNLEMGPTGSLGAVVGIYYTSGPPCNTNLPSSRINCHELVVAFAVYTETNNNNATGRRVEYWGPSQYMLLLLVDGNTTLDWQLYLLAATYTGS